MIDAWRVDVADEVATIDMLSTVYQMGYRIAALVGGAFALFLAERTDWPTVFMTMGVIMLVVGFAGLWAPDAQQTAETIEDDADDLAELRHAGQIEPRIRAYALGAVALLWGWALITVIVFMVRSLGSDPESRPDSVQFISTQGPLVVIATVVIPSIIAAWLESRRKKGMHVLSEAATPAAGFERVIDHGYRALVLPLTELVGRLGLGHDHRDLRWF